MGENSFSGIRDNHFRGRVGDLLRDKIKNGSKLSFVSAYFTIYAYEALRGHLEDVESLRFLFGEPSFVNHLDTDKTALPNKCLMLALCLMPQPKGVEK